MSRVPGVEKPGVSFAGVLLTCSKKAILSVISRLDGGAARLSKSALTA